MAERAKEKALGAMDAALDAAHDTSRCRLSEKYSFKPKS
jgi:hypothetical protein